MASPSESLIRAVLEHSSDGILLADAQARIVNVLHPVLGYTAEELMERSGFELIHPEHAGDVIASFGRLLGEPGRIEILEYRVKHKDGSWHWIECVGKNLLHNAEVRALVVNYRDITERRLLQEQLLRRSEELARSNAELEHFAYLASHDLQEPLRSIMSFSELLQRRHRDELAPEAREYLSFVAESASQLQELVDDLLAFSRLNSENETEPGPVDMNRVLNTVLASLKARIEESGAIVTCDSLPDVVATRSSMQQLLQNLVGNAIKYRKTDVLPRIHISAEQAGSSVVFRIADNGIGIDPRYHDQIFAMFKRLHAREIPGTGIGLAICKRIVDRYHGRIWVESEVGKGSVFAFELPK